MTNNTRSERLAVAQAVEAGEDEQDIQKKYVTWGQAEEIISTFAGEPTLSRDGQALYFVHHFYTQDMSTMLEADIYVSNRLEP